MTRKLSVALGAIVGTLALVPSAQALTATPVWQCRGSAVYSSVAGQNRVEPIVANGNINTANGGNPDRAQCVDSETGAGNTPTQLGISPNFLGAVTGKALTTITPELGFAIAQKPTAEGRVEDLTLLIGAGDPTLGIGAANSTATATCTPGSLVPTFSGDSRVADLTLGGAPLPLDQLVIQLSALLAPLGALVEIKADERIQTADSLTIRALHVKILRAGTPLLDLVVGEAKVGGNGPVCDPAKQGGGSGNVCPPGSELDVERTLCIIRESTSGSSLGDIIVGRPFEGPSGGTVVPIDVARKRFPTAPCLKGTGAPRYAIVGTNSATGSPARTSLTGSSRSAATTTSAAAAATTAWRAAPVATSCRAASATTRRTARTATTHSTAPAATTASMAAPVATRSTPAYGADRTFGGAGNDAINIATQGPRATANCGSGSDKVRFNQKERARHPRLRDQVHDPRPLDANRRCAGGAVYSPAREPPRADQDVGRRGRRIPRGGADGRLRDERPRRLPAPHAAVVRRPRRRAVVVDVREVPEGAQPRTRPARHAAGRGGHRVLRAARCHAEGRRDDSPRHRPRGRARARAVLALCGRRRRRAGRRRPRDGAQAGAQARRAAVHRALARDVGSPQARRHVSR